jgi:hypothetical protein
MASYTAGALLAKVRILSRHTNQSPSIPRTARCRQWNGRGTCMCYKSPPPDHGPNSPPDQTQTGSGGPPREIGTMGRLLHCLFRVFPVRRAAATVPVSVQPQVAFSMGDIAVDNPQATRMVRLHLKQSKTDQFVRRETVILWRTGLDLYAKSRPS